MSRHFPFSFRSPQNPRRAVFAAALACLGLGLLSCSADSGLFSEPEAQQVRTGAIEGFVFDQDTNPVTPKAGAKVYTLPTPEPGALSDPAGFYRLPAVPEGPYFVVALDASGRSVFAETLVRAGEVTQVDLVFGVGPVSNQRELGLLTQTFTPGVSSLARVLPEGGFFQLQPLARLGGRLRSFRWSRATSDEVVVVSDFESPAGEIYVSNLRTNATRRLTTDGFPEDSADLSPDGLRVVFAVDTDADGGFEIVTSKLDGTSRTVLVPDTDPASTRTRDSRDPVWSPDGTAIAYVTRRTDTAASPQETAFNLFALPVAEVVDPLDPRFGQVVATSEPLRLSLDIFDDRHPIWDLTSSNLFYDKREAGIPQIYTVAYTPGGREVRLTNDTFQNTHPTISFDGRSIAWISTSTLGGENPDGGTELFLGEFVRRLDRVGAIAAVRQITRTPAGSAHSFAAFRPQFPGPSRLIDGTLRP